MDPRQTQLAHHAGLEDSGAPTIWQTIIFRTFDIFWPGDSLNMLFLNSPTQEKYSRSFLKLFIFRPHDIFSKTIRNPSEIVPKPLLDTSQDILKLMKKWPRTNLRGAGNRTGDLQVPGPKTNPQGYSGLAEELL